jgi:Glu-tRNA(Gln) amidotransferase subunit E-like FAD-binding protein
VLKCVKLSKQHPVEGPEMMPKKVKSVEEILADAAELEDAMSEIMIHHSETPEEKAQAIADHPRLSKLSEDEIANLEAEILDQIEQGEMMRISDQTDAGQGHLG